MLTLEERHKVIARLDETHIRELASKTRDALEEGKAVELCYQPGDATWYSLTIAYVGDVLGAPGGGGLGDTTEERSFMGITNDHPTYVIAYAQSKTAMWITPDLDDPYWVAGKLTDNHASATAIGCLLEQIFGFSGD